MEKSKIDRINYFAKESKTRELTPEEFEERKALRKEYILELTGNLRDQLENTYVVDEDGNKKKLKD